MCTLAAALGAATGATVALVVRSAPAHRVGAVSGIVGAAGGLGGCLPPLLLGSVCGRDSYSAGLGLLAALGAVATAAALLTAGATGRPATRPATRPAG